MGVMRVMEGPCRVVEIHFLKKSTVLGDPAENILCLLRINSDVDFQELTVGFIVADSWMGEPCCVSRRIQDF